ncbi:hypothetical protein [Streptomyces bikiniensis]|uniref:hypothetical protein n=1 Tax=Streptomyces bikiniensis TaxID=1896 RepID=UPI0004C25FEC|nr:hypothetical protein [Streptomyces bikiniensis]
MERSEAAARVAEAVHDLASDVVSALKGGDHSSARNGTAGTEDDGPWLAAVRMLGPDLLLPALVHGRPPHPQDVAACRRAADTFPPRAGSSPVTVWSHWALTRMSDHLDARPVVFEAPAEFPAGHGPDHDAGPDHGAGADGARDAWPAAVPWQQFTHQLALLAPLAVPGDTATAAACGHAVLAESAVARAARQRPVDLARGFVRAVRRRDWLQAAAAGRWLAVVDDVPKTLGLDSGLDFVLLMGGSDPRVDLHVHAAQHFRAIRSAGAGREDATGVRA